MFLPALYNSVKQNQVSGISPTMYVHTNHDEQLKETAQSANGIALSSFRGAERFGFN